MSSFRGRDRELELAMKHIGDFERRVRFPVERRFRSAVTNGDRFIRLEDATEGHVILMVAAHARQVLDDRNAVLTQFLFRADP